MLGEELRDKIKVVLLSEKADNSFVDSKKTTKELFMSVTSIYRVTFIDGQTGIFSAFSALHVAQKASEESNVEVVKIEIISRVSA